MEASDATTTEAPPESTAPAAPEPAAPAEDATPDVGEQIRALNDKIDGVTSRLPEQEPEPTPDFFDLGAEPEGYQEDEEGQPEQQPQQDDEELLRQMFREEAEAIFTPQMRQQQLQAYVKENPDVRQTEVFDAISAKLAPLAERYGRDVFTNPELVMTMHKLVKAEAAAAAETPAEAVGREGGLETGAGPGAPDEADPEQQYRDAVFGATQKSPF